MASDARLRPTPASSRPSKIQSSPALPGPRGLRLLGSLREVRRDRLGFVLKLARQYGDVVGFRMGWRSAVLVNHPDGVRHVLRVNPQNYCKGIGLAEARPLLPRRDGEGDALDALLAVEGEPAPEELRDEVMTLLLAGHETSAATLAWTWYLVSQRPAVRERLEGELAGVLGDRVPTFADVPRLEYTRMVVQETLRLYPAVWMIPRRAIESDEILSYRVAAGADVLISPYALHRHPGFWDAPDEFLPERFAPSSAYPADAYLPFGQGPRACVGSAFGMLEAVLVVATVAARYRLDLAPGCAPVPEALLTLKVRGLHMRLHPV